MAQNQNPFSLVDMLGKATPMLKVMDSLFESGTKASNDSGVVFVDASEVKQGDIFRLDGRAFVVQSSVKSSASGTVIIDANGAPNLVLPSNAKIEVVR